MGKSMFSSVFPEDADAEVDICRWIPVCIDGVEPGYYKIVDPRINIYRSRVTV